MWLNATSLSEAAGLDGGRFHANQLKNTMAVQRKKSGFQNTNRH